MRRSGQSRGSASRWTTLIWPVALLVTASCGDDDSTRPDQLPDPVSFSGEMTVPSGWQGIWEMGFDLKDPDSGQLLTQAIWYDTLCVGDSLSVRFGPMIADCDGYVRGDSLVFAAEHTWQEGACDVTFVFELKARRDGGVVRGAGEWRVEMSGACGSAASTAGRELIELNGVRTGDVPEGHCR